MLTVIYAQMDLTFQYQMEKQNVLLAMPHAPTVLVAPQTVQFAIAIVIF